MIIAFRPAKVRVAGSEREKKRKEYDEVLSVVTDFAKNSRKEEWKAKRNAYYERVGDSNEAIVGLLEGL